MSVAPAELNFQLPPFESVQRDVSYALEAGEAVNMFTGDNPNRRFADDAIQVDVDPEIGRPPVVPADISPYGFDVLFSIGPGEDPYAQDPDMVHVLDLRNDPVRTEHTNPQLVEAVAWARQENEGALFMIVGSNFLRDLDPQRSGAKMIREGDVFHLGRGKDTIGSRFGLDPQNTTGSKVSNRHALVQYSENRFVVIDHHSTNGTSVKAGALPREKRDAQALAARETKVLVNPLEEVPSKKRRVAAAIGGAMLRPVKAAQSELGRRAREDAAKRQEAYRRGKS